MHRSKARWRIAGIVLALLAVAACDPIVVAPSPAPASSPAAASSPGPASSPAGTAERWPRPADTLARTAATGLQPEVSEHLEFHVHAHLDVFVDGAPVVVPAGIGINIDDPGVKRFDEPDGSVAYGGITSPCGSPCISPLHTHATTGILHTESSTPTPNNLGQFFDEWGVALRSSCIGELCDKPIAFYLNGAAYTGDPRSIQLANQLEIAIVIGTPPPVIPATADFSRD